MNNHKYTNGLINETSPYLLQHAHNPVNWYPWGKEALELARQKDMPILLSIGYSSCHWCHVMERESFENEDIAQLMNENFVCIKVDREERPDLDEIYMNGVQAMTGSGGWPMTVFLTPELKPFFAGTYFPPVDMYGRPGFVTVLNSVSNFYKYERGKANDYSDQVLSVIRQMSDFESSQEPLTNGIIYKAYRQLSNSFDHAYGGFGNAPKFPQSMSLSLLMRYWQRIGDKDSLEMAEYSLQKMAQGGMYDQLGGGFHRYSVDEKWLIPHFEKMLYDNALLTKTYLEAYQITKKYLYYEVAEETLDYVLREMYNPQGGFYSAQDADSEGEEGKYYVWSLDEIKEQLGEQAEPFISYYGITEEGNFENGANILHINRPLDELAIKLGVEFNKLKKLINISRERLLNKREKRIKPGLDDKILTSWNALMISSMTYGYRVIKKASYLHAAVKSTEFILNELSKDGMLLRSYRNDQAKFNAYSEDYGFMINALIDLYETDFQIKWLREGIRLNDIFIREFWDNENGGFFYTGNNHEELITRSKSAYDGPIPSANSIAAMNLLRLASFTGNEDFKNKAGAILRLFMEQIEHSPSSFSQMLCALDSYLIDPKEIVVVGKKDDENTIDFIHTIHGPYIPSKILVFYDPSEHIDKLENFIPLLKGRTGIHQKPIVYICQNYVCKLPIDEVEVLKKEIKQV